jgi:pimeloyl-ACP methyl ester carboxylesterase
VSSVLTDTPLMRPAGRLVIRHSLDVDGAPPILLIHPINLRARCWDAVATALAPQRRCVMPDLRGHGDSATSGDYGLEFWARDCLDALDHLGIDKVHLIGGSLGGTIAVHLAAQAPDRVASVIAVGSQLRTETDDSADVLQTLRTRSVPEMFRDVIPRHSLAPGTAPEIVDATLALTNPNDAATVRAIWRATVAADATDAARAVRCPALVLTGEFDATCLPEAGAKMADALGATQHILPGVGHLPMLESPEPLSRLIRAQLDRVDAAKPADSARELLS